VGNSDNETGQEKTSIGIIGIARHSYSDFYRLAVLRYRFVGRITLFH